MAGGGIGAFVRLKFGGLRSAIRDLEGLRRYLASRLIKTGSAAPIQSRLHKKWPGAGLNHRRRDFQSLALPLSYPAVNWNWVRCAIRTDLNGKIIDRVRIMSKPLHARQAQVTALYTNGRNPGMKAEGENTGKPLPGTES